jgi:hypothetical protein
MASRELEIVIDLDDKASKKLTAVKNKINDVNDAYLGITRRVKKAEKATESFSKKSKVSLAKIAKVAVVAATAVLALRSAFNLAEKAAKFEQARKAFDNIAASYGANADSMIADLKRVSGQTLSTAQIIETAGNAMVLGIPAERLEKMMEIARASSRITGQSIEKSFNDIVLGSARQSRLILDNIGIIVKVEEANQSYAKSLNKTVEQLTDTEKKTAFLNATMAAGDVIISRIGVETATSAEKFQKFSANIDELSILMGEAFLRIGGTVSGFFLPMMDKAIKGLEDFFTGLDVQADKWDRLDSQIQRYQDSIAALQKLNGDFTEQIAREQVKLDRANQKKQEFLDAEIAKQIKLNNAKKEGQDIDAEVADPEFMAGGIEDPRVKFGQESEIVLITQRAMANEAKLEQLRVFHTMELDLAAQHGADLDELTRISALQDREEAQHTAQFRMETAASAAGALSNIAQNLNTALGGKSKKMFKIMQAAAIAQTAIDTSRAAMGAYASLATIPIVGPALGIAAAAAAVASGMAQIQQIKSQKFGGGGSVSIGGGANPARTGGGASAQGVPVRLEEQDTRGKQEINITFQADGIIAADTLAQMSEQLIQTINDAGDQNLLINAKAIAG